MGSTFTVQCAALRELLFGLSGYEMFTTGGTCRKSLILFNLPRMDCVREGRGMSSFKRFVTLQKL